MFYTNLYGKSKYTFCVQKLFLKIVPFTNVKKYGTASQTTDGNAGAENVIFMPEN
jgi:hypothetical protein